jgi:predicted dehydrogenase
MRADARVNVAIIGCGLIGTEWDAQSPECDYSLTHAAAFSKNPRAQLIAVCDQDLNKARRAAQRWGAVHALSNPRQLFSTVPVDLVVIATSSAVRWSVIEPALAAGVKVLVIEKPLATTLAESRRLVAAVDLAGLQSVVNFSRHWDPNMHQLRTQIAAGDLGSIQRLVGTYGKGIGNNGSHMIDLVAHLCNAQPQRARALGSPLDPSESSWSSADDRTWDAQVEFTNPAGEHFHLTMLGTDQHAFTCFELRIIGRQALCELTLGGRRVRVTSVHPDPNFAGYSVPGESQDLPARALEAMDLMADEALRLATGDAISSSCNVHSALRTALTVEAVNRSARSDGQWIDLDTLMDE